MAAARALLVAYITLVSVVCAQCGQDKVFSLPITNVTLSNGAAVRGIPISVGTPPQTLAFAPQWLVETSDLQSTVSIAKKKTETGLLTIPGYTISRVSVQAT